MLQGVNKLGENKDGVWRARISRQIVRAPVLAAAPCCSAFRGFTLLELMIVISINHDPNGDRRSQYNQSIVQARESVLRSNLSISAPFISQYTSRINKKLLKASTTWSRQAISARFQSIP